MQVAYAYIHGYSYERIAVLQRQLLYIFTEETYTVLQGAIHGAEFEDFVCFV